MSRINLSTKFRCLALWSVICAAGTNLSAGEILFQENFDSGVYKDDAAIVIGPNLLDYGVWGVNNKGAGQVMTVTNVSLSPTRSLALVTEQMEDQAQAVARIGQGGQVGPTGSAVTMKFAFQLAESNEEIVVVVRSASDDTLATLYLRSGEPSVAIFDKRREKLARLDAGKWYRLILDMPENPGAAEVGDYQVTLLEEDGATEVAKLSGPLNTQAVSGDYAYVSVYQMNRSGAPVTAYFDDFAVETKP